MTVKVKIEGVEGGLNAQISKADEIAILKAIAEKFTGTQTYLESLFSRDFVTWVEVAIRNDLSPDIQGQLVSTTNELSEVRSGIALQTQQAESDRKSQAEAYRLLQSDKENVEAHHKAVIETLEKERSALNARLHEASEKICELRKGLSERDEAIERRDREILELKARLYDLTQGKDQMEGQTKGGTRHGEETNRGNGER